MFLIKVFFSSKMLEASMRGLILDISDVDKKTVTLGNIFHLKF